jgi:hypothetical protein
MTRAEILDLISSKYKFDVLIPEYRFKMGDAAAKITPILSFKYSETLSYLSRINSTISNKHNSDMVVGQIIPTSSSDYSAALSRAEAFAFFEQCPQEIIDSVKTL